MIREFRDDLDKLFLKLEPIKYLALLLEDYFYRHAGDLEYKTNQSLATINVEKIKELEKFIDEIYKKERN